MKVSVIVPNYNHAEYLRLRLDSILDQTYRDFEVIILDDCSSDDSRDVIESYRGNPSVSHIVYNQTNSGSPFHQWKKGMQLACGELVWIAESDDCCETGLLERLVEPFTSDRACVLSFCASDKVDASGNSSGLHENLEGIPAFMMDGNAFNRRYMKRNVVVNASSAVFRKSAGLGVDNGFDRLGGYGDYMFWIGLASVGKVAYTPEILNHFRFHSTNTTSAMTSSIKGLRETIITDKFLLDNGIIGGMEFLSRNLSSAYRMKYRFGEEPPFDGAFFRAALSLKRAYRQALGKDR